MQLRRVVVTGLGAITPIGNSINDYWKNLLDGVSGAAAITRFDASKFKTRFACEVKGFNIEDYFDKSENSQIVKASNWQCWRRVVKVEFRNDIKCLET